MNDLTFDTIVIGKGAAGFAAASVLKAKGQSVGVLYKDSGASSVSSGAWDVVSALSHQSLAQALESEREPLRLLAPGSSALLTGIPATCEVIQNHLLPLELSFSLSKPFCLPTTAGSWKITFGAQASQAKADLSRWANKKLLLVGSPSWRFNAEAIAKQLTQMAIKTGYAIEVEAISVVLKDFGADSSLSHVATRLMHSKETREAFDSVLIRQLKEGQLKEDAFDAVLFPPIFFDAAQIQELEVQIGKPILECLATTEPLPGLRLLQAFDASLLRQGIPCLETREIQPEIQPEIKMDKQDRKIISLKGRSARGDWHEWRAKNIILATGKFFSGGVDLGFHEIRERIFNLPLFTENNSNAVKRRSQMDWREKFFYEPQTWSKLGIKLNDRWQPIDESGQIVFENLYACGSGIGGCDFARLGMGLAFMAFTGRECANVIS